MIERLPHHHLPDHVLLEYASGTLAAASAMLVACHLTLCPSCRGHVQGLEAMGGALLEAADGANMTEGALESLLARLDTREQPLLGSITQHQARANLPRPLLSCLPPGEVKWRRWLPGVRGVTLDLAPQEPPARLVQFKPGIEIPLHDHEGSELLLVLDGKISESDQVFLRGDVAVSEPGHAHSQRVDAGSACIALIVNQGPLIPLTPWGRVLKLITGL